MIDPRRLAFDIDGVLADTMNLFLDIVRDVYGVNHIAYGDFTQYNLEACLDLDPEIIAGANERIIDGDYPCCLAPIDGATSVLKRLSAFGPIRLVTARPYLGPIKAWIEELLPPDQYEVEMTASGRHDAKPGILKAENIAFFVEDRLDTCFLLKKYNITPVVFAQPWNREPHPFMDVDGWQELEKLIDWQPDKPVGGAG